MFFYSSQVCDLLRSFAAVPRLRVQKWCLDQGFELIELEPEEDSDSEEGKTSDCRQGHTQRVNNRMWASYGYPNP